MFSSKFKKYISIIFILTIVFYFSFNVKDFFFAPYIVIENKQVVVDDITYIFVADSTLLLQGHTRDVKKLVINTEEIFLDIDGNFKKKLYLYKGQNKTLIKIITKGEKEVNQSITVYRE